MNLVFTVLLNSRVYCYHMFPFIDWDYFYEFCGKMEQTFDNEIRSQQISDIPPCWFYQTSNNYEFMVIRSVNHKFIGRDSKTS